MKKDLIFSTCVMMVCAVLACAPASAQTIPAWKNGKVIQLYADPEDVVVELDGSGPCGATLFNIKRAATNFEQLTALLYTAAAQGRPVGLYVTSCLDTRNIVSVGRASFQ